MNENCKNSQSASNLRWYRQKLPASESSSSSHMRINSETGNVDSRSADEDTGNVVNRIIANPCEIRTQVAKISLNSEISRSTSSKQLTQETFQRKRQERKREVEEITNQLKEIGIAASIPSDGFGDANTINGDEFDMKSSTSSNYRRCKTEVTISRSKSVTARTESSLQLDTLRSGAVSTRRTEFIKSQENLPTDSAASKRRSYNPIEARRFMKEQKKKRRANSTSNAEQKVALEKEQIKKRLEDLRKSSRMIITKNLKKNRVQNENPTKQTKLTSPSKSTSKMQSKGSVVNRSVFGGNVDFIKDKAESTTNEGVEVELQSSEEHIEGELPLHINSAKSERSDGSQKAKSQYQDSASKSVHSSGIIENQRRVGLLRKPEMKDHSFSAIREFSFDKENVALDMLTPKIPSLEIDAAETHESRKSNNSARSNDATKYSDKQQLQAFSTKATQKQQPHELPMENPAQSNTHSTHVPKTAEESEEMANNKNLILQYSKMHNLEEVFVEDTTLKSPKPTTWEQAELEMVHEPCEKSTQVRNNPSLHIDMTEVPKQTSDLPYWLRPSAVQIYPYNFIQAVRRKIESIIEPASNDDATAEPCTTKHTATNVNDDMKKDASLESVKADSIARKSLPVASSQQQAKETPKNVEENVPNPQTPSDVNSNFNSNLSSISLQIPVSNTVSEVSSLKSESVMFMHLKSRSKSKSKARVEHEDDTTVSSSIFSSPEKRRQSQTVSKERKDNAVELKTVSPLSLERIEKFKIVSKRKDNDKNNSDAATTAIESNDSDNVDFNKLLSDFNHGLSQVIEANEQLKSTLDRSQQILSPAHHGSRRQNSVATHDEYTTDFEDSSQAISNKTNSTFSQQSVEKSKNEHQNSRKRKLFQVATPLLTSPKLDYDANNGVKPPEFELNLKSMTPTSVYTTETESITTTTGTKSLQFQWEQTEQFTPLSEQISPHAHEERLATIDQLKENLRRMINDSKAERHAVDRESASTETYTSPSSKINSQETHKTTSVKHSKRTKSLASNTPQSQLTGSFDVASKLASTEASNSSDNSVALSTTFNVLPPESSIAKSSQRHSRSVSSKPTQHTKSRTSASSSRIITEDLQHTYESPRKDNKAGNTRRSRSAYQNQNRESFIHSHINASRGEYTPENDRLDRNSVLQEDQNSPILPAYFTEYPAVKKTKSPSSIKTVTTTTTTTSKKSGSSQVITRLRISDLEISRISSCDGSVSESSLNYSNVGLYEQLIKNETTKSEYLTALLKMREKAILDRTKGQIAWLEVQKERYKSKGLMIQIAAIRKKQRAIIMKMEKEREEIKRILQTTQTSSSNQASSRLKSGCEQSDFSQQRRAPKTPPTLLPFTLSKNRVNETQPLQNHHHHRHQHHHRERSNDSLSLKPSSAPILRANYELETSASLEELLRQREKDLRKRREYVERLMEWHRKLDQEEAEVLNLERMLFAYNANLSEQHRSGSSTSGIRQLEEGSVSLSKQQRLSPTAGHAGLAKRALEMERRLKEIDKSLRELNNITATGTPLLTNCNVPAVNGQDVSGEDNLEFVRTTGSKLNKLWRRLTSQHVEKFEPNRRYKLCKSDLERLYEEAKRAVLTDFAQAEERSLAVELLDRSVSNVSGGTGQQSPASFSSIGSAGDIINAIDNNESAHNDAISAEVFNCIPVPNLNLNFSTSQSEEHEEEHFTGNSSPTTKTFSISKRCTRTGDYSPSAAERNFQTQTSTTPPSTPVNACEESRSPPTNKERSELLKRNMRKFLNLTTQTSNSVQRNEGLERSLSDTQLASSAQSDNRINGASKCSLWAAHQNENKFHVHVPKKVSPKPTSPTSNDESKNQKSISGSSNSSYKTTASSIIETDRNIPSHSISLTSQIDTNSGEPSPLSSVEKRQTKVFETSTAEQSESKGDEVPTAQSISRTTVIRSLVETGTGTASHSLHTSKEEQTSRNVESTSISIEQEAITSDFESKSNEIATKLSAISEAVARLSQSDSIISQKSTNSAHNFLENISDDESADNPTKSLPCDNTDVSYTLSFESPAATPPTSHTPKTQERSIPNSDIQHLSPSVLESHLVVEHEHEYESEFDRSNNETLLDDVSMPRLDTTFDTTAATQVSEEVCDPVFEVQKSNSIEDLCAEQVQKGANLLPTSSSPESKTTQSMKTQNSSAAETSNNSEQSLQQQLMPDIINELEIRRCQQILLESEQFSQYEHVTAVPYMYVREIPNKPPPPYCPPAHGSPMTTIFPSEERIKDITYRRTHELYCKILKTDHVDEKGEKLPSVLDEQITNIYERIILDICREFLDEHHEVLTEGDPANFHSQLAYFNPPDRLRCIQESIYKEVRRCLAMDKTSPKRTPIYSIYGHRAKRDHVGKIIIQEMYEEDDKWCNFHHEEDEVLELIIEEMIGNNVCDIAKVVLVEEGGVLQEEADEVLESEQSLEMSQNAENEIEASAAITIDETTCENINETAILESASTCNEELKV